MALPRATSVCDEMKEVAKVIAKVKFEYSVLNGHCSKDNYARKTLVVVLHMIYERSLRFGVVITYDMTDRSPIVWIPLAELMIAKRIQPTPKKVRKVVQLLTAKMGRKNRRDNAPSGRGNRRRAAGQARFAHRHGGAYDDDNYRYYSDRSSGLPGSGYVVNGLRRWGDSGNDARILTVDSRPLAKQDWMVSAKLVPVVEELLPGTRVPFLRAFARQLRLAARSLKRYVTLGEFRLKLDYLREEHPVLFDGLDDETLRREREQQERGEVEEDEVERGRAEEDVSLD